MKILIFAFLALGCLAYVPLPAPFTEECILEKGKNFYHPKNAEKVKWYTVNLDDPPELHFKEIATEYRQQIRDLIQVIKDLIVPSFPEALDIVHAMFEDLLKWIPEPYNSEIRGIAKDVDLPVGEIVLYNVFYEVFTVCTSIVAQQPNGRLIHARNLDFGLFLGWNGTTHEWQVSSILRKMVVNINWLKDGKVLFKTNNFAGFTGVYNGLKQNKFTVTANERFMLTGGLYGMLRYILGLDKDAQWMTWHVRKTLETANTYNEAKAMLSKQPIMSPVYYILAGAKPFEASIITRNLNTTDDLTELNANDPAGWYLLETNYDPGVEPLFIDDRDTPGRKCMNVLGQKRVNFQGIYNVLSSQTNLNKLTTYTVLMEVHSGQFETHLQECPGYCWGW